MLLFNSCGRKNDDETIGFIAKKTGTTIKTVKEMLEAGLRSEGIVPFFKNYGDEDSEETAEDVLDREPSFCRIDSICVRYPIISISA